MSKSWWDTPDDGGAAVMAHAARRDARRRDARRTIRRRRALALGLLGVILTVGLVALVVTGSSLAGDDDAFVGVWWSPDTGRRVEIVRDDDAFVGVWWSPDTGRRVEIVRDGDGYALLYGAQRRPFAAERRGDELAIAAPLGGDIIVRAASPGRLVLVEGQRTTTLLPAPDGS
jgi:hypothetical protein